MTFFSCFHSNHPKQKTCGEHSRDWRSKTQDEQSDMRGKDFVLAKIILKRNTWLTDQLPGPQNMVQVLTS